MEVGSGSSSNSSSSSSSESINGLKFGKKGYFVFEDAGGSSSPAVSGRPPPALAKKGKKGGVVQGGQPPVRCQVEGCQVGLRSAKAYYSRHKVCGIHSKSAKVIVAGFEQRFCQQCSRFHLLTEFDQGKRSCRRRLACHNERRRKPPPGTLFGHYGSLSSHLSADERSSKTGSFMLDFSAQPVLTVRDSRPNARTSTSELALGNPQTDREKFPPHPWNRSPKTSSEILIQGSTARTNYFGSDIISSRECLTGVSDCSRALSLLSTQPWDSRDQSSSLEINGIVNANVTTPTVQPSGSHSESTHGFSNTLCSFKVSESNSTSYHMSTESRLIQSSQPAGNHYHGDLDAAQQNGSRYLGLEHSMGFDSSLPEHSRGYLFGIN